MTEAADWSHPFLRSGHQIYVFISHPGRFGRILCSFSITEAQFPCENTIPCVGYRFMQAPAVLSVLSCPPAAPSSPCGCRRISTGFRSGIREKPLRRSIKHRTNENHHFSEYLPAVYIQAQKGALTLLPSSKLNAHPAGPVKLV